MTWHHLFLTFCTLCLIFLTISVTVAFAERTFSKLKLIKNYLKNTISQERLKILQFSISKEKKTSKINIDKTIYGYTFKDEKKNSQIVQRIYLIYVFYIF